MGTLGKCKQLFIVKSGSRVYTQLQYLCLFAWRHMLADVK